jgi:hypothetical protein
LSQFVRILNFHNSKRVRELRAKNGDTAPACACDFCKLAERRLNGD